MEKKLFLLDALALIYRAYYSLIRSPRITSKGRNTNAHFGFTNTLYDLINKEKPTHLAVVFDTSVATQRHTDFVDYKANRQDAPEDLSAALPDIKRIIEGFNIPVVAVDGYEADDAIGALAKQAAKVGYQVYMVTPDKDYGQLVDENIFIYKPGTFGNAEEILGVKEVCEKWGIQRVEQVIDILGLMGDAVDNIPGIPGVGQKTAAKLLAEYDNLENILANADKIKGSLGEKIRNGKDSAVMSKKLATIILDVPVAFHEENYRLKDFNRPVLNEVFTELEFKSIGKRILGDNFNMFDKPAEKGRTQLPGGEQMSLFNGANPVSSAAALTSMENGEVSMEEETQYLAGLTASKNINNTPHDYHLVQDIEAVANLISQLSTHKEICFDTETTSINANDCELVGLSFSWKVGEGYYVPCPADNEGARATLQKFKPLFDDEGITWVGQNIKYDLLVIKWYGVELKGPVYDTMLAHYVIEPEGRRNMDLLSAQYLGYEPVHIEELIGKKGKGQGTMRDVAPEKIKDYAAEDADITLQLKQVFAPMVEKRQVKKVLEETELPLVKVLADMEFEGVRIDVPFLESYSKELDWQAKLAQESVYAQAGLEFNIGSPKQMGEILFEKLKLDPNAKKTKTGQYATGEDVLAKLATKGHKIAEDILIHRELTKLQSTYVDSLPKLINRKTGRVHTSYAQAVAVTGRLSSTNPNLQNIPIRTERGREIRKAFIARDENHLLISADYSQIELRIVAAISADPNMCDAFRNGIDVHTATAAKVFNVPVEEVTKEMRYKAKSVNFGIIYGQSAFGLSENLKIPRSEAKDIIDNYRIQFPNIQMYMDANINFAREHSYVETMMGRKRWLRDINSSNFTVRGFAERNAINSPIQGTAADMIKLAMIKIHQAIKDNGFKGKMILQVHDELVFDVPKDEVEAFKPMVLECMKLALPLPNEIPVEAEAGEGTNWLEAH